MPKFDAAGNKVIQPPTEEIGELVEDLVFRAIICERDHCKDGPNCETYLAKQRLYEALNRAITVCVACNGSGDLPDAAHAWDCGENAPQCDRCGGTGIEPR